MRRFMLTCAAALLGTLGCDYEPICPDGYDFDQTSDVCLFVGDAGTPPVPTPDSGPIGTDAGPDAATEDAGTGDDSGAGDSGAGDSGAGDSGADAG